MSHQLARAKLKVGARHFFANVCSPPPHGRDKSSPYNTGDKSLHEQFIARFVGAQFHCARGGNGASQKNGAHTKRPSRKGNVSAGVSPCAQAPRKEDLFLPMLESRGI